jgi:hypothetical protein
MIIEALEAGVIKGDGPFYPQPPAEIRPRPERSFRDRTYCVAMSPDSSLAAAELGATMMTFVQATMEAHLPGIEAWRDRYLEKFGEQPKPPVLAQMTYCHPDPAVAEQHARDYMARYFDTVVDHYEFTGTHFGETKGYTSYDEQATALRAAGASAGQAYADTQLWGTPEQLIGKLEANRGVVGDFDLECVFTFGGIPIELAEASMKLFATEVMPVLKEKSSTVGFR